MKTPSPTIAAAVLALGAMTAPALAEGPGYGSTAAAAASLGFTASPPIARPGYVSVAAPAAEPSATGSITRRDRVSPRFPRRR